MSDLQSGPARALLEEANIVLVDGAFYHQDELIRLNFGTDDAHNMCHLPMLGSAPLLATLGANAGATYVERHAFQVTTHRVLCTRGR